jgi:hypothetical protein
VQDKRTPFFELATRETANVALRRYGDAIGELVPWDDSLSGTVIPIKIPHGKKSVSYKLIQSMPWRYIRGSFGGDRTPWSTGTSATPFIGFAQVRHWTNCLAVLEGRLEPLEGVDYAEFLETYTEQMLMGLSVPGVEGR